MATVEVRNGYKFYGKASNPDKKIVLNYLNMTVMPGTIYGLLGASGCGKTTLLSCIIGQRELQSGDIRVFGAKPGQPGSGIPGPRLGYMPQDIALVKEMTVKGTIYYFGRIYGLSDEKIRERYKMLKDLLELPPPDRAIGNCSGGQQRRVSFACAMVHEPELLILDEPTVGLDPLLRERIWDFLVEATRNSNLAVIITTHYIEEAKQANCIGLMRNGFLLAEDTPENILQKFECQSVEDAFLVLCQRQGKSEEANEVLTPQNHVHIITSKYDTIKDTKSSTPPPPPYDKNLSNHKKNIFQFTTRTRMKALMVKNVVQLTRHISALVFMFVFPILQTTCFFWAVGKNPKGFDIGIVNYEIDDMNLCMNNSLVTVLRREETCEFHKISCRFLQEIDDNVMKKIYYDTEDEALVAAKKADIVGYIKISQNFSEATQFVIEDGKYVNEFNRLFSELIVRLDMSDFQLGTFVERTLREAHGRFMEAMMVDCNLPRNLVTSPVRFEKPLYGTFSSEYQRFAAPGVLTTMIFFLATLTTSTIFITERCDGIWERTLVAGISTTEMLVAHTISQTVVMILQSLEVVLFIGFAFNIENHGSNIVITILIMFGGFAGMAFGLLISIFCHSHTLSNFVGTGAFYPMIILCGMLWPLEGMPDGVRHIALTFPFTIPTIAARNILDKGWSLCNYQVYNGFLVLFAWIIVFLLLCFIGLKRKA